MKNRKKICVVIVDRANYGRIKPVMQEVDKDLQLELQVVCSGTTLLDRFGNAAKIIESDGFNIDARIFIEVEGSIPTTMAKSIGLGIIEFSTTFQRLEPDIIMLIGDRYEALAAAVAAAYTNIPIAHIQGGEVSGSIDESARHVITKLSHLHFPSTVRSVEYILKMGEKLDSVFNVGCPCGDVILHLKDDIRKDDISNTGIGHEIDLDKPYFLVIFHPVTTEYSSQREQTEKLLSALNEINMQTIWVWPNIDAGADKVSKAIRIFREKHNCEWLFLVKNLEADVYNKVLKRAACAIGNSSSFVRDSTFTGTPVVLVGNRQQGREHGNNLINCAPEIDKITEAVRFQLDHGRYEIETLYGKGNSSKLIVKHLKRFKKYTQKQLSYVEK